MSLPINDEENEKILSERPGDEIYQRVKDKVEQVKEGEQESKGRLVDIILEDMIIDLALSNSVDSVGEVIEYLAQDYKIERPSFDGKALMRDLSRISKLDMSIKYAELLNMDSDTLNLVIKAEIERLWGDTALALLRRQVTVDKSANPNTQTPTGVKQEKKTHEVD